MSKNISKIWNAYAIISIIISPIFWVITICVDTPRIDNLEFDYQGVIVGILSLLVTIILGWNIYTFLDIRNEFEKHKSYSNNKLSIIDSIKSDIVEDRFRNKYALDANVNLMQGEFYLLEKYYLTAYREFVSSLVKFNSSGDTDLYKQIVWKIEYCIRSIRRDIKGKGFIIDWDFDYDIFHNNNLFNIIENKNLYPNLQILEKERILKSLIDRSDCILVSGYVFQVYKPDIEVKEKAFAIYALFKYDGNVYRHYGRIYSEYALFINDIMLDLDCDYDYIGVCKNVDGDLNNAVIAVKSVDDCVYMRKF